MIRCSIFVDAELPVIMVFLDAHHLGLEYYGGS